MKLSNKEDYFAEPTCSAKYQAALIGAVMSSVVGVADGAKL